MNKSISFMLGDWVGTPKGNGKVISINYTLNRERINIDVAIDNMVYIHYLDEGTITPIPLTLHILEKNGFEWDGGEIWTLKWEDNDGKHKMHFRSMYDKQGYWNCLGVMIGGEVQLVESVSDMQHLLIGCGLDEMAENFKVE